jgi:hypothetical protein
MADTEPKVVEEVPAAVEEAQDPKVGGVSNCDRSHLVNFFIFQVTEVANTIEEAAKAPEAPAAEEGPTETEAASEETAEAPVEAEPSE